MPQYREKSKKQNSFGVGLLTYPVLQASDILLYQPDSVPVGEDQRQHLELARDLAERFNNRYGQTFTVPRAMIPEVGAKVMDLQDPASRMSTSADSDAGVIRLLDPPDTLRKKIRSAITDSGREVMRSTEKPGVTNLIELFSATTGEPENSIEERYADTGYGPFKTDLADAVVELLSPIQKQFVELRNDETTLGSMLESGAQKAHKIAAETLASVHDRLGLVPPIQQ
tara:strand:- start:651 stop:1331 length:681 start_codon:yes stop_codon:yes gene_type:complete